MRVGKFSNYTYRVTLLAYTNIRGSPFIVTLWLDSNLLRFEVSILELVMTGERLSKVCCLKCSDWYIFFGWGKSWPGSQQRGHISPKSPPWSDVHHHQHQTRTPSAEMCMLEIIECLHRTSTLASASLWSKSGGMIQACKEKEEVEG